MVLLLLLLLFGGKRVLFAVLVFFFSRLVAFAVSNLVKPCGGNVLVVDDKTWRRRIHPTFYMDGEKEVIEPLG